MENGKSLLSLCTSQQKIIPPLSLLATPPRGLLIFAFHSPTCPERRLVMKKQNVVALMLAAMFVIAGAVVAGSGRAIDSEIPAPPAIGTAIEDFTIPDVDGKDRSL